jgi:hypothetical protein
MRIIYCYFPNNLSDFLFISEVWRLRMSNQNGSTYCLLWSSLYPKPFSALLGQRQHSSLYHSLYKEWSWDIGGKMYLFIIVAIIVNTG